MVASYAREHNASHAMLKKMTLCTSACQDEQPSSTTTTVIFIDNYLPGVSVPAP